MKNAMVIAVAVMFVHTATAQYNVVSDRSLVEFSIKNFGVKTSGSFSKLNGQARFDNNALENSGFVVSVEANSIQTGNDLRDSHLREKDYFNVALYPTIHFVSTKISKEGKDGSLLIKGQLTIKNHSSDISFPFTATSTADGYLFNGSFRINRKDFEVGGSGVLSDSVEVHLKIMATR